MNICEKCGLTFYRKEDQALCGNCRRKDGAALRASDGGKDEKKGFWRRWWAKYFGAGRD